MTEATVQDRSRVAQWLFAASLCAAAALILWINRDSFLFFDEALWFADLGIRDDISSVVYPHNNHLIGLARSLFLLLASTIGVEYVALRIVAVIGVLLVAVLFFVYARRRVGDWIALFPAILLAVYGSAWQHVVSPIGLTITFSIAAGLGALLALERGDRRGDVLACVLAVLSIFTYTIGLSYLVGIAVSVLLRPGDRIRRAWIFLVPLLLYVPWWLWARQFSDGRVSADNIVEAPIYAAKSLANVAGSLTGVAIPFSRFGEMTAGIASAPGGPLGIVFGVGIAAAVAWRMSRGSIPRSLWVSLAILTSYWTMSAIADTAATALGTQVNAVRYILPGSVALLLVLIDAGRGYTARRWIVWAVATVFVFSLVMNLFFLRDGGRFVRDNGARTAANLAMVEIAGGLDPGRSVGDGEQATAVELPEGGLPGMFYPPHPSHYLSAVEKFGSPAPSLGEIRELGQPTRLIADQALIALEGIVLEPAHAPWSRGDCMRVGPAGSSQPAPLPEGDALIRPVGDEPAWVSLSRFSDAPGVGVGIAAAKEWTKLRVRVDGAPDPWMIHAPGENALTLCPSSRR